MANYRVSATALNMRSQPKVVRGNILAVLSQGKEVTKIADAPNAPWWHIETTIGGTAVRGFVNSTYLVDAATPTPHMVSGLKVAHLTPSGRRSSTSGRANPLNEESMPGRKHKTKAEMVAIINWLDVETGLRWKPGSATFCNIYAFDVAYLAGVYLPRVWWNSSAIQKLKAGQTVPIQYGTTVYELNANALVNWFEEFGATFGWRFTTSLDDLQDAANQGKVCVICAQRTNLNAHGHIVIVAPENGTHVAHRVNGVVKAPLQSQAGGANHVYWTFNNQRWWTGAQFGKFGFWIHD